MMKEPIFLKPALASTIWGGTRLMTSFGYQTEEDNIAEAWVLSCHPDGESVVTGGVYDGRTLTDVLAENPAYVGMKHTGDTFPILIKLIDADRDLSIQVHPDDAYAAAHEPDVRGKTEAWYIIDAAKDAKLIYGFRDHYTKEQFRAAIENKTLTQIVNSVTVKPGDVAFIPSGTLHAICEGIFLAEVQQSCNTTYRVYDYDRPGKDGKPRPLHIDKAVDVTRCDPPDGDLSPAGPSERIPGGTKQLLTTCDYFTSHLYKLDGPAEFCAGDESFVSLVVLEGCGTINLGQKAYSLNKADSVFIPAGCGAFTISGRLTLFATTL